MTRRVLIALAVVALLVVVLDVALGLLPMDRPRAIIEELISEAAGTGFRIEGKLRFGLLPGPHVEATRIAIDSPERKKVAEIGRIDLWLHIWPLFRGALDIYRLDVTDAKVHIEASDDGAVEISEEVAVLVKVNPADIHDIYIRDTRFQNLDLFFASADGAPLSSIHFEHLRAVEDDWDGPIDLEARGHYDGGAFDLSGQLGSYSALIDAAVPFDVALKGVLLEATGEFNGSIADVLAFEGVDLGFDIDVQDFGTRMRDQGMEVPKLGAVHLTGRLTEPDGSLGLQNLVMVTHEREPIRLHLTGSIGDLAAFREVELTLAFEAPDAKLLEPYVERVPDLEKIKLDAKVSDAHGPLGINGKGQAQSHGGEVSIEFEGEHLDMSQIAGLDVGLAFRAANLKQLGEALRLETALPAVGPIVATARLRDRSGAFALEDIVVDLGREGGSWAHLEGSIGDLERIRSVQLASDFGEREPRVLETILGRPLPQIGALRGHSELSDRDGSLGLERLRLTAGSKGLFSLEVTGTFDDIREIDEIQLDTKLWARDLAVLGELVGADLPALGPVEFDGRMRGSDEKLSSKGKARFDQTRFTGNWTASFAPGARRHVKARIHSPHVRLADIGLSPEARKTVAAGGERAPAPVLPIKAPEDPLSVLRSFDADLDLDFDRVTGRQGLDLKAVRFDLSLQQGDLRVSDFAAVYKTGEVKGDFRADARTAQPALALDVTANGIDGPAFWAQLNEEHADAGDIDLYAAVHGTGSSLKQVLSSLTGRFGIMIRQGAMVSRYGQEMVRGIVRVSLPSLRADPEKKLACVRAEFDAEDGLAEVRTFQINGEQVTVVGEGAIDLGGGGGGGSYDMVLTPRAHNPAVLGVAATVLVSGPLDDPKFSPVTRSLATSAVRGLLSNAMRPAGAVLSPFRSAEEIPDPCDVPFGVAP